jgi:hypothetical protein
LINKIGTLAEPKIIASAVTSTAMSGRAMWLLDGGVLHTHAHLLLV